MALQTAATRIGSQTVNFSQRIARDSADYKSFIQGGLRQCIRVSIETRPKLKTLWEILLLSRIHFRLEYVIAVQT